MVNIDELNRDIEKFGIVVEKVEELPDTYEKVNSQAQVVQENTEILSELIHNQNDNNKEISEKLQAIETSTIAKLEEIEKKSFADLKKIEKKVVDKLDVVERNATEKLQSVEKNAETKLEKSEMTIRDRISLLESNTKLSINRLQTTIEEQIAKNNENIEMESIASKKRFYIMTAFMTATLILDLVLICAAFGAFK